jgi:hypothetical protein
LQTLPKVTVEKVAAGEVLGGSLHLHQAAAPGDDGGGAIDAPQVADGQVERILGAEPQPRQILRRCALHGLRPVEDEADVHIAQVPEL